MYRVYVYTFLYRAKCIIFCIIKKGCINVHIVNILLVSVSTCTKCQFEYQSPHCYKYKEEKLILYANQNTAFLFSRFSRLEYIVKI